MSLHKTYTEKEIELLKLHGLHSDKPSQLSDAFIIGFRYGLNNLDMIRRCDISGNDVNDVYDECNDDEGYPPCHYCGESQCDCDML